MHDANESEWEVPPIGSAIRDPKRWAAYTARKVEWAAANPELAADWTEAIAEDDRRTRAAWQREREGFSLRSSGLPERSIEAWAAGLKPTKAVEAVRTFIASDKTFLLLLGSPGCGKTVATAEALREGGTFRRAVALARLSSFDRDDRASFLSACEARTLVVDDLGAEMLHDGWRPALDELMDIRYGAKAQTIITSNLDGKVFKERYGERIADRIRHDGFIVTCGDKSERRQP